MARSRRRTTGALGLSLGVHGLVCWWLFSLERQPVAPLARARPLELVEVKWLVPPPVEPPRAPLPTVTRRPPRPTKQERLRAQLPTDLPRAAPGLSSPPNEVDSPIGEFGAGGATLLPGDAPSAAEQRAEEAARVAARVDGWLSADASRARVRGGLPDPAYGALGSALREATDEVPSFIDTNSPREVGGALAQSWLAGAERYGKTGAPYAEPEGRLESVERPSALVAAAAAGHPDALNLVNFLAAGARLQEFADGRAGLELYALVEVRQLEGGAVDSVRLVKPSGLRPFDAWVTERAGGVVVTLGFDAGARAGPLRSVWRFDGIMKFRRQLKPSELNGRAVLGMMTMAALSALSSLGNDTRPQPGSGELPRAMGPRMPGLTGRFDELTGALDVVDLTNPTYDCQVTLVEAD